MAYKKISELTNLPSPANDDFIPVIDSSENETKKITYENLIGNDLDKINIELANLDTIVAQMKTGWNPLSGLFTYASWDSTVSTGVINTNIDLTAIIELGDRLKYTQDGTVKFGIVTVKTSTTLTLYLGTDFTLTNTAITDVYFSHMKTPYGFNTNPDKWTIKTVSNTNVKQNTPAIDTWYNLGGISINIPIGSWNVSYSCSIYSLRVAVGTVDIQITLSNANNTQLSSEYSSYAYAKNILEFMQGASKSFPLNLISKATYYLNAKTYMSGISALYFWGSYGATVIKAVCAYL